MTFLKLEIFFFKTPELKGIGRLTLKFFFFLLKNQSRSGFNL